MLCQNCQIDQSATIVVDWSIPNGWSCIDSKICNGNFITGPYWNEEYCQTSPNKNKSPNLWHVTSILVCCIFVCTCKTHLALYAWTQYQPVASQQSTNSYKMNEGCWTQRFITPPDCLLYSNKVKRTKRYFLFLSVCNTNNNARKWSVTSFDQLTVNVRLQFGWGTEGLCTIVTHSFASVTIWSGAPNSY